MSNVSTSEVFLISSTEATSLRRNWGWTVAFGVLLALAGIIALGSVLTATIASVLVVGVAMIASGIVEIIYGIRNAIMEAVLPMGFGRRFIRDRRRRRVQKSTARGQLFDACAGRRLVASGLLRIVLAFHLPKDASWIFVGLSGVVTLLLGVVVVAQWPISSQWVIGTFLGVDLIFAGAAWIGVGLTLKRAGT